MTGKSRFQILTLVPQGERSPRLEAFLNRAEFRVLEAPTGRRALEIASEIPCDLIVALLPVPDTSLGRLVSELRLLERSAPSLPLVLMAREPQMEAALAFEGESVRVVDRSDPVERLHEAIASALGVAARLAVRVPAQLNVEMDCGTSPHFCETRNLSASGMLVSSSRPLPVGSVFDFEIMLPRLFEPLTGRAEVVRLSDPEREDTTGFAARFIDLANASKLDRYVRAELRAP